MVIPDSITIIGEGAFKDCTQLSSVTLPAGILRINNDVFYNCTNLTSITFEGTVEQWNAITKVEGWFYNIPATEVVCCDGTVAL